MALKKGTNIDRGYATVIDDEGVNYRDIADTMSELGYVMNHSSVRNYILRIMKKFVEDIASAYNIPVNEKTIDDVAKSPQFQHGIADILHIIEGERRFSKAA